MRRLVQGFVVIIGFAAAIAAVEAQQIRPSIANCYDVAASNLPTICE